MSRELGVLIIINIFNFGLIAQGFGHIDYAIALGELGYTGIFAICEN